jgi:pimeloyl-ACP methyl ester carboxylesterase
MTSFREDRVTVGPLKLHVVEAGDPDAPAVLFLHGWPESSRSWHQVMALAAADGHRAVAIDLPGIGGSAGAATDGSKAALAEAAHGVVGALGLPDPVLVGQDVGGMVTYSYLREYGDGLRAAVIMDVVIPGLDPWAEVIANPYIWHFALHTVPDLPETLVRGNQRAYFDYFYDQLSADPAAIPARRGTPTRGTTARRPRSPPGSTGTAHSAGTPSGTRPAPGRSTRRCCTCAAITSAATSPATWTASARPASPGSSTASCPGRATSPRRRRRRRPGG